MVMCLGCDKLVYTGIPLFTITWNIILFSKLFILLYNFWEIIKIDKNW